MIFVKILVLFSGFCFSGGKLLERPRKVNEFGQGAPIYGINLIRDRIYLIRDSTPYVEIYESRGANSPLMNWTVPGMQGPYDMVGGGCRSMYIVDWFDWANISVVSTKVENSIRKFSIGEPFTVVSLTEINTGVLVTCSATQKIKEFTKLGVVTKEVNITEIVQPRHAIKLEAGGYAVCHGYGTDQLHRVCSVNDQGVIQLCHGGHNGSSVDELDVPARLLELRGEGILVADRDNQRVVLLDSVTLKFKQVVVSAKDGLKGPTRMFYECPLLYVADDQIEDGLSVSGKMLVFRIKQKCIHK